MDEYIERRTAISKLIALEVIEPNATMEDARRLLADMPAADVAPVVHGHKVDDGGFYARCSQCDGVLPLCANYCPNCGAKMDGGDSDEAD